MGGDSSSKCADVPCQNEHPVRPASDSAFSENNWRPSLYARDPDASSDQRRLRAAGATQRQHRDGSGGRRCVYRTPRPAFIAGQNHLRLDENTRGVRLAGLPALAVSVCFDKVEAAATNFKTTRAMNRGFAPAPIPEHLLCSLG